MLRYVDGAKAASSILQQDQRNVGALFLRGFCLYHKNNIERALTHFQQVRENFFSKISDPIFFYSLGSSTF